MGNLISFVIIGGIIGLLGFIAGDTHNIFLFVFRFILAGVMGACFYQAYVRMRSAWLGVETKLDRPDPDGDPRAISNRIGQFFLGAWFLFGGLVLLSMLVFRWWLFSPDL